jgi:hypothetical protein
VLLTDKKFSNYRLIADWCLSGNLRNKEVPVILSDGKPGMDDEGHKLTVPIRDAGQASILLRGSKTLKLEITSWPLGSGSLLDGNGNRLAIPVFNMDSDPGKWNRFEITVSGQQIRVVLNGEILYRDVIFPDISEEGPIGLVFEGAPIQFANLYIKELKE